MTWYLDQVLPNEFGARLHPLFFLNKSYWYGNPKSLDRTTWLNNQMVDAMPPPKRIDRDVLKHRLHALNSGTEAAIQIVHLRKEFKKKSCVKGICLALPEGELFALLGQNGAGKTTTMNMLCGLATPTSGDALVLGNSIRSQMDLIRKQMGVCPQYDTLFQEMTAEQHILLFAGLKGVDRSHWNALVEERLKAVRLYDVKDDKVSTFSGGYVSGSPKAKG